jgi:hypothetical protein
MHSRPRSRRSRTTDPPDDVVPLAYQTRRHAEIGEAVIAETRAHQQITEVQTRGDRVPKAARECDAAAA